VLNRRFGYFCGYLEACCARPGKFRAGLFAFRTLLHRYSTSAPRAHTRATRSYSFVRQSPKVTVMRHYWRILADPYLVHHVTQIAAAEQRSLTSCLGKLLHEAVDARRRVDKSAERLAAIVRGAQTTATAP
jgi:hypothetical protein